MFLQGPNMNLNLSSKNNVFGLYCVFDKLYKNDRTGNKIGNPYTVVLKGRELRGLVTSICHLFSIFLESNCFAESNEKQWYFPPFPFFIFG